MPSGNSDAGPAPLTSAERTRLVAILGRLGSEFQGERAAAGLLASRMLREFEFMVMHPDGGQV